MRTKTVAFVLATLGAMALEGRPGAPALAGGGDRPPFLCYSQVWQGAFEVAEPRCDGARLTWDLKAKKKVTPPAYEARLADADGVEQAVLPVALEPERDVYRAGATLRAVVRLPGSLAGLELAQLVIREKRR
jgi:hypothetical protein